MKLLRHGKKKGIQFYYTKDKHNINLYKRRIRLCEPSPAADKLVNNILVSTINILI